MKSNGSAKVWTCRIPHDTAPKSTLQPREPWSQPKQYHNRVMEVKVRTKYIFGLTHRKKGMTNIL